MKPIRAKAHRRLKSIYAIIEFEDGPPAHIDATELGRQISRGYGINLGHNYNGLIEPKQVSTGSGSALLYATTEDETIREIALAYQQRLEEGGMKHNEVFWEADND